MKLPLDKDEILKELSDQISLGLNFMRTRREKWRMNLSKYVDQDKEEGRQKGEPCSNAGANHAKPKWIATTNQMLDVPG